MILAYGQTYYKVLDENRMPFHGGNGQWPKAGTWTTPANGALIPCENGYHVLKRDQLILWLGPCIWEVEPDKEIIEQDDKCVTRRARLICQFKTWNKTTQRLFAADCAERVLPIFETRYPNDDRPRKVIQAARDFANGKIGEADLAAAGAAAWDAARAADIEWQAIRLFEYLEGRL